MGSWNILFDLRIRILVLGNITGLTELRPIEMLHTKETIYGIIRCRLLDLKLIQETLIF